MISLPRTAKLLVLVAAIGVLAALPVNAHAMLNGLESNAEFTNSDRTPALLDSAFDRAHSVGAQVIRGNVNWADVASNCGGGQSLSALADNTNPCYNWGELDNLVHDANERGVPLLFSVSRSPQWVNNSSDNMYVGATSFQFSHFVQEYTSFIRAIATRYDTASSIGTVNMWTIWNEPNSAQFWGPIGTKAQQAAAPMRYAELYKYAAIALRSVNHSALIAPGPTGPSPRIGVRPGTFIAAFQKDAMKLLPGSLMQKRSYINAWAHNPYPYVQSPRSVSASSRLAYPNLPIQRIKNLVALLDSSPLTRGRMIWATEFGYETFPGDRQVGISERVQGPWMATAFDVLDATNRVSVAIWYGMTDPTNPDDWQSGAFRSNGTMKPAALWEMRPISVSSSVVKRGARVQVYAKSTVNPAGTRIQYSTTGTSWKTLIGIRQRADHSIRANIRVGARKEFFRVYDGVAAGPAVAVVGK